MIRNSDGSRLSGILVEVYVPGGGRIPNGQTVSTNRADDRNYEMNIFQPGNYQVVIIENEREVSQRASITINFIDQCNPNEGQPGSQWGQVDFRKR